MKTSTLIIALLATACSFPTIALARPGNGLLFKHLDADGDGRLTRSEVQEVLSGDFQEADTDGDGFLSLDELTAYRDEKKAQLITLRYSNLDSNGNGLVSQTEYVDGLPEVSQTAAMNLFSLADSDQSGQLNFSEFTILHSAQGRIWKRFARMDKDGDQQISEYEFIHRGIHRRETGISQQ